MDRKMIYPGQIPLETDLLDTNRFAMIGLGKLAAAVLGTSTLVNGFACTPTAPASMQVQVAPGEIYSLQNLDGTAFSSLAADTTHQILKQGLSMDAVTLSCPAPATAGQSINYLVQVTYQDVDANPTVLPYYNASNPAQAYSGPNNSGTSQSTVRQGVCQVAVKVGVSATSGTQVTPAPDPGYTGLYVVTVANGASTITGANISTYSGAPFLTENLTQKISQTTGDARYATQTGFQQNAYSVANAGGTADAITATYSPVVTALTNGMTLNVRTSSANATATPTFTPNNGTIAAKTIVKGAGAALVAGDIAGGGHWIELQYDLTLDKWVLLNPATGVNATQGNYAGLNSTNVSATLALSDLGKLYAFYGSTTGQTLTLPALASVPVGKNAIIVNQSSVAVTVKGNAAENISSNTAGAGQTLANTMVLNPGDSITLSGNGGTQWNAYGYASVGQFPKSLGGSSGYMKLPGGLIMQWGVADGGSAATGTTSFPIAFPTVSYGVVLGNGTGNTSYFQLTAWGLTNFSWNRNSSNSSQAFYVAFGY